MPPPPPATPPRTAAQSPSARGHASRHWAGRCGSCKRQATASAGASTCAAGLHARLAAARVSKQGRVTPAEVLRRLGASFCLPQRDCNHGMGASAHSGLQQCQRTSRSLASIRALSWCPVPGSAAAVPPVGLAPPPRAAAGVQGVVCACACVRAGGGVLCIVGACGWVDEWPGGRGFPAQPARPYIGCKARSQHCRCTSCLLHPCK